MTAAKPLASFFLSSCLADVWLTISSPQAARAATAARPDTNQSRLTWESRIVVLLRAGSERAVLCLPEEFQPRNTRKTRKEDKGQIPRRRSLSTALLFLFRVFRVFRG